MDCIEKFKGMQECFQKYPDVYKGELEDDEELDAELELEKQDLAKQIAQRQATGATPGSQDATPRRLLEEPGPVRMSQPNPAGEQKPGRADREESPPQSEAQAPSSSEPHPGMSEEHELQFGGKSRIVSEPKPSPVQNGDDDQELIPKAAHDTSGKNTEK